MQVIFQKLIDSSHQRDTQKDAHDPEEAGAHGDRREDQDAGQPDGRSHHAGIDELSLQLLEHHQENQEKQRS